MAEQKSCVECHDASALIEKKRPSYWHFEMVHRVGLEKTKSCVDRHADMVPNNVQSHAMNRPAQVTVCANCHGW